ncbi:MAG: flagellar hook protein FlgE [Ignavibacteriae bacterium]|nr:flagellar hook protein FlgE [Ignavibacteriota bacterium]
MGLSRALSISASSLRINQRRFDVISNNLANVNTYGYKSSRMTFADLFSQTFGYGSPPEIAGSRAIGGVNPMQFGLGVKIASVSNNMSQGSLEYTDRPLDLALQGEGFFVYNLNNQRMYSRAGMIALDKEGYFVDSTTGAFLQGYSVQLDASNNLVRNTQGMTILDRNVKNLQIPSSMISPPQQTHNVEVTGNLNANMPLTVPDNTRSTTIVVYDQRGGTHTLDVTFEKVADAQFNVTVTLDGDATDLVAGASPEITFNADGTLNTPNTLTVAVSTNATFQNLFPDDITINLSGQAGNGLTNYAGSSSATAIDQDGFQSGELSGFSIDTSGKVWGAFTNGKNEVLGQIVMAKFSNPGGLLKDGSNMFKAAPNSGSAFIGTGGEDNPSTSMVSGALEQSNVDLTSEFTDIITTQRAFEASARTISVSDQMLQETNNLRR